MNGAGFRMRNLAAVVGGLVVACAASATTINGTGGASIEYVTGGARIADGSGVRFEGRTFDIPSPRHVGVVEPHTLRIGGNDLSTLSRRNLTPALVTKAGASLLARSLPVIGTGLLIWDLFDVIRVRPDGEGGLKFDPGTDQVPASGGYTNAYGGTFGTMGAACTDLAQKRAAQVTGGATTSGASIAEVYGNGNARCDWQQTSTACVQSGSTGCTSLETGSILAVQGTGLQCPASVDFGDPSKSIPAGLPPGPDGKCRTGAYSMPMTPTQAGEKLEQHAPPTGEKLKEVVQDVIQRGGAIEDAPERTMSGPASKPGPPSTTTTTNPDGSTTTVTKTPTTNYTYTANTINYSTSVVTVTNNAGNVTTTVENEAPEPSDLCKDNPDALACIKLGTPGDAAPVWDNRNVPFMEENLGFGAGCPAPVTWQVFGMSLSWSYQPICDIAPMIRFAFLAMAAIGAISIVVRETSS